MNKKILAGALSMTMMVALVAPVHAETQSASTNITTTVPGTYIMTIPNDTAVTYNATSTTLGGKLKVTSDIAESVTVTATPQALQNEATNAKIPYILKEGDKAFASATWGTADLTGGTKEVTLSVEIEKSSWNAARAGEYKGSIIFTGTTSLN